MPPRHAWHCLKAVPCQSEPFMQSGSTGRRRLISASAWKRTVIGGCLAGLTPVLTMLEQGSIGRPYGSVQGTCLDSERRFGLG